MVSLVNEREKTSSKPRARNESNRAFSQISFHVSYSAGWSSSLRSQWGASMSQTRLPWKPSDRIGLCDDPVPTKGFPDGRSHRRKSEISMNTGLLDQKPSLLPFTIFPPLPPLPFPVTTHVTLIRLGHHRRARLAKFLEVIISQLTFSFARIQ